MKVGLKCSMHYMNVTKGVNLVQGFVMVRKNYQFSWFKDKNHPPPIKWETYYKSILNNFGIKRNLPSNRRHNENQQFRSA